MDGTGINDRAAEKGWTEVKVGIVYSQTAQVAKDRVEILDKRTYASLESAEEFRQAFVDECAKAGAIGVQETIFVSDGARWIKQLWQDYFPQATYILDFWHLDKNLRLVLGWERRALIEHLRQRALLGDVEGLCRPLEALERRSRDGPLAAKLQGLLEYIRSNQGPRDELVHSWGQPLAGLKAFETQRRMGSLLGDPRGGDSLSHSTKDAHPCFYPIIHHKRWRAYQPFPEIEIDP